MALAPERPSGEAIQIAGDGINFPVKRPKLRRPQSLTELIL
jgi:hypothetical protein